MNETIKEFLVGLGFDIDEAGLKKFVSGITTASMRAAALGAAVTAAAGFVMKGIDDVAKDGEKLELLALKFNTTAAAMDDWGDTAEIMGIGSDKAFESIEALSRVVSEAAIGIGRGKIVLEKLGIKAKDASGHIRSTTDVMDDLRVKMQGMDRGQAMNIMEKLGLDPELLRMFNGELGNTAKVGEELSAIDASVGFDFDKNIAESRAYEAQQRDMMIQVRLLQQWFTKLWAKLATDLMPMARAGLKKTSEAFESLRKIFQENGKKIVAVLGPIVESIMKIGGAFVTLAGRALSIVLTVFGRVFDVIMRVNKATDGWAGYIAAALVAWKLFNLGFLATPIGMIASIGVAILALYDDFMTWKEGGESFIDWGSGFGEMLMYATALIAGLGVAVVATKTIMMGYAASMGIVNASISAFSMISKIASAGTWILNAAVSSFTIASKIAAAGVWLFNTAINSFSIVSKIAAAGMWLFNTALSANPIGLVVVAIGGLIAAGVMLVQNWDLVKTWFADFFGWFSGKWNEMKDMASGIVDSIGGLFGDGEMAVKASTTVAHTIAPGVIGNAPTPTQQAAVSRTQNVAQTTNINVTGGNNPQATAQAVATAQGGVNKNMARNMKGAVR